MLHYKRKFPDKIVLENERVLLRPLKATDLEHLLPFAETQPDLWQYSLINASGKEGMKNYIDLALLARTRGSDYPFIVFDKLTQSYAGSTRFYDIQMLHRTSQLGYTWYGKEHQGSGLNKNCKYLMLEFAFDKLGLERVEFRADGDNSRSIAAMKRIGCTEEGVLRSHGIKPNGDRRDSIILSILKHEWNDRLKETLQNQIKELS